MECNCTVTGGVGIEVTGTGNVDDPYIVTGIDTLTASVEVEDTESLDLTIVGAGTTASPYVISGQAIIGALIELVDDGDIIFDVTGEGTTASPLIVSARLRCLSCGDPASQGDVPRWDEAQSRYVPGPAPTAPFGAIVADDSLSGTGLAGSPLRVDICTYDELAAACDTP
jgi:hypothetical protein